MLPRPISAKDIETQPPRKPRPGARPEPPRARPAPAPLTLWDGLGRFWERGCVLIVLLVLFLIPILYPLRLTENTIALLEEAGEQWPGWGWFYNTQLFAFLNFLYQPLRLKEGAFSVLVVVLLFCWLLRELSRVLAGRESGKRPFDWALYGPIIALIVWSAVTLLYSPTFYWSLTTYACVIAGLLWFVVLYQMPKTPRRVRRGFNTILLAAGIVALFAFLQDVDTGRVITGKLFVDLTDQAANDPTVLRLRMGSLIGHNIGVASFLAFAWFIGLMRLFQRTSWRRKVAWGLWMVFLFYVIAATQTRGIWVVLGVLTPCHLVWLLRLTGRRWDLKPVLAVILLGLVIVMLQGWPSERNPFYSPESPLLQRFRHFSPAHLLTDIRVRIPVCSSSLIIARPVRGHGLGSFQYVYPPAQAEYFARHPHTFLTPSPNRTMRAHSDWLQILIELGLPGLLIVLAGVYLLLRRGWNAWLRLRDPTVRLELTAALMGVIAVLFHALADFPIHVISTAVPFIFLFAVWASCGRLESADESGPPPEPATQPTAPARPNAKARRHKHKRLLAAGLVAAMIPVTLAAAAWFYSLLHVSMYESLGTGYRIYYGEHAPELSDSERRGVLETAYRYLKKGHKLCPLYGDLIFRLGEVSAMYGVAVVHELEDLPASADPKNKTRRVGLAREADAVLRRAIDRLNACQNEVRYHEVFHYLGLAYEYLHRLHGEEVFRQEAKRYYRQAVRYSPCFSRSLFGLFRVLQKDRPPDPQQLREVYRAIARYDPLLFHERFTQQVWKSIERRDYERALQTIDTLIDIKPDNSDLWLKRARLLALTGQGVEADILLDQIQQLFPDLKDEWLLGYRMEAAVAKGRYDQALAYANTALQLPENEGIVPYNSVVRAAMLEKLGRPEAEAEWERIEQLNDQRYFISAVDVYYFLLDDPDAAFPWLMKSCAIEQPAAPPAFFRIAARMLWERGEQQKALDSLETALERDPEDPLAHNLLRQLQPEATQLESHGGS